MGLEEVCSIHDRGRRIWYVSADLIVAFGDPPTLLDAAVEPDGDRALARLRSYLHAHFPAVDRRCDVELDDLAYYDCPSRADAVTIAYAIARVHRTAKARWTVPATAGVLS
jgi:hypothetical protein